MFTNSLTREVYVTTILQIEKQGQTEKPSKEIKPLGELTPVWSTQHTHTATQKTYGNPTRQNYLGAAVAHASPLAPSLPPHSPSEVNLYCPGRLLPVATLSCSFEGSVKLETRDKHLPASFQEPPVSRQERR